MSKQFVQVFVLCLINISQDFVDLCVCVCVRWKISSVTVLSPYARVDPIYHPIGTAHRLNINTEILLALKKLNLSENMFYVHTV